MIVCIDTNIVIYSVERDPVWEPKVEGRFKGIAAAGDTLAASDAARLECLVGPFQSGDAASWPITKSTSARPAFKCCQ